MSETESLGAADRPGSLHKALHELRTRADQRRHLVTMSVTNHSPEEVQRMVQELQVHQIELEMQYEELLRAQMEAETVRAQFIDLYEFAPMGYCTVDEQGVIEQLNLAATQLLGTVRQQLVGRQFPLFVEMQSRQGLRAFLLKVLAADTRQSCELTMQRQDGTPFVARLEGLAIRPPGQIKATRCRLALIDVTASRRTTEALQASEARFRKLFESSNDAVVLLQGRSYLDCNEAALRLLGAYRKDQLVGQLAWSHAPEHQPDGTRTADMFLAAVREALRRGSMRCEALMYKLTGEEIWVEAVLTPIELGGGEGVVHVVWRDVTATHQAAAELRKSEEHLQLALDASRTGIFTWNMVAGTIRLDRRARIAFGLGEDADVLPIGEVLGRFHPDDADRVNAATQAAVDNRTLLALEYRLLLPDGTVRYISSAGQTIVERGQTIGFTGVVRDVTARRAEQEELHFKNLVVQGVLENLPLILKRLRPDGTIVELSGEGLRVLGANPAELVGRNIVDLFPEHHDCLQTLLSGGRTEYVSELKATGRPVYFRNYGFFDEQRQEAIIVAIDVTQVEEQKRQLHLEKEFSESLLDNSIDGIVAIDRQGRVVACNKVAEIFFLDPEKALRGRLLSELVQHVEPNLLERVVDGALQGERLMLPGLTIARSAGHFDAYFTPLLKVDNPDAGLPAVLQADAEGINGLALVVLRDVSERDRLMQETTALKLRQQQEVLAAILTTQEQERRRIAESLHNGVGQLLYATKLNLESNIKPVVAGPVVKLLDEAIKATRTISFELTPGILEDFGLKTALEELVKRIPSQKLNVQLNLEGLREPLPKNSEVAISVYRIVQELLNNIIKHARAADVFVHILREGPALQILVEDDGVGFDASAMASVKGIGLAGIRNRVDLLGGQLSINSRPGRGTIVTIDLPVK
ncbi:PAS domain S-box protein [Hymenobacter sp. BT175]|uniref:PAS domain S-box protein n=1 Tax=Hymenobacter translucens TaxID=2886507 RepID=UPI001D0F0CB6|nr:PAS domain S-box protein [Hymenobacter translucens]MCC2546482.1 PAS domain S-box protein [Hymenobacter translucens]